MNIVGIDDDRDIGYLLALSLEVSGHVVIGFTKAADALLDPATYLADVIVLDWNMPDMSGAVFLREYVRPLGQKIVVYTAAGDGHEEAAMNAGADAFLVKGHSIYEELIPVLEDLVHGG